MKNIKKRLDEFADAEPTTLTLFDRTADRVASWSGSWNFLMLHIIWFTLWLGLKIDISLLTMIVSLEAIILMTILLMAQNRQAQKDNWRDEADYQADIRSEKEILELKKIVQSIHKDIRALKKK